MEDSLLPKLAAGFGGGIARRGSVCGALVGSIMIIGAKFGRTTPDEKEAISKVYKKTRDFLRQFERQFGSSTCYTLTGCNFENRPEHDQWLARGGRRKCSEIVAKSAEMLLEIIDEE